MKTVRKKKATATRRVAVRSEGAFTGQPHEAEFLPFDCVASPNAAYRFSKRRRADTSMKSCVALATLLSVPCPERKFGLHKTQAKRLLLRSRGQFYFSSKQFLSPVGRWILPSGLFASQPRPP